MAKMNPGFLNLKKSYLFIEIGKRVREYIAAHPDNKIIKMGIGDVTQPLAPVVVEAMKKAADEMGVKETFRGFSSGRESTISKISIIPCGADMKQNCKRPGMSSV